MMPVLTQIKSITFSEALVYSLIGFLVVFIVLIVLMVIIRILRTIMEWIERTAQDKPDSPPDDNRQETVQNSVPAESSIGEVCLFAVDDRTAAMLMAMTADQCEQPLNELRFLYMHEEGECDFRKEFTIKSPNMMLFLASVEGKRYEVGVEPCEPLMVNPVETSAAPATTIPVTAAPVVVHVPSETALQGEAVKAPLAGVILAIKVNKGDSVKAGQVLLILEAMKMENEIIAPRDGKVAQITTSKGSTVETDAVLLTLE